MLVPLITSRKRSWPNSSSSFAPSSTKTSQESILIAIHLVFSHAPGTPSMCHKVVFLHLPGRYTTYLSSIGTHLRSPCHSLLLSFSASLVSTSLMPLYSLSSAPWSWLGHPLSSAYDFSENELNTIVLPSTFLDRYASHTDNTGTYKLGYHHPVLNSITPSTTLEQWYTPSWNLTSPCLQNNHCLPTPWLGIHTSSQ